MIREIMLHTSNDLRDFMHLACTSTMDVGVHTMDNQIADGKSVLGLMAIDYKKPVKVVSDDEKFMKQLDRWAV
ncbi:HPr family phosphocarrier protein [Roseburia hominis]